MTSIGHPSTPTAVEFFMPGDGGEIIPQWYQEFVYTARAHEASQTQPILSLVPRPFVDFRKELVTEICQAMSLDLTNWPIQQQGV
jgi:hypothetical protein